MNKVNGADGELIRELMDICGRRGVLTGEDVSGRARGIWDQQGITARAIVRPASTQQVSAVLALCHENGQTVVPHGGLTGLVEGAASEQRDIVLSLERMSEIEEIDATNRTMLVQAGATLQDVQEAAEAENLEFTLDLGARGSCTIGGNVATNAGGNRVIRYGMTREQVLGLEAVLADGTVVSALNQMIKNNAGYDLKQLFIGSEGTLGIVTRMVLRLRELPGSQCTALVAAQNFKSVARLLKHMDAGLGGRLSAFEAMWRDYYRLVTSPPSSNKPPLVQDYPYYALVEALGSDQQSDQARFEQVLADAMERGLIEDAVIARSGRERDALWEIRDDVERTYDHGPPIVTDVSMKLSSMEEYVAEVRARLDEALGEHHCWIFGHMGDGNLHIVVASGDDSGAIREKVERALYEPLSAIGGSVSAEHGIGLEKKPWLAMSRSQAEIDLMRSLKRTLDPKGILNPGKIF